MQEIHSFHIPVMGTGFSIDTPVKVAQYGISSVISLVDDTLIEQMRKIYCKKMGVEYIPITKDDHDYRAKRITEYLNLVDRIVKRQFEELKTSAFEIGSEITKYFELIPDHSPLKALYNKMLKTTDPNEKLELETELRSSIKPGDINVNIMTKLDRTNYAKDGSELPEEFSDALSALRGFAKSTLTSAVVFSAGLNRRLYSYVEEFKDFYADASGLIKKKIILKVSDFRSSIIQGKFFAKKGLWISEYHIESGLNCGGHAFATDGFLMGPILEEFKAKKQELINYLHTIYNQALALKHKIAFNKSPEIKIRAQGGIGSSNERKFLHEYYKVDGTGWCTPFLLVPEATNVDDETLEKLSDATEDDLYLSDVSPLGVPFNNIKDSLSDTKKNERVAKGHPGNACPKGHLVSNSEFTEKPICIASRTYQKLKIDQLKKLNLNPSAFKKKFNEIVVKSCICHDLGASAVIKNNISEEKDKHFPAVCPGPNLAYFSKIATLKEMVGHIYGRINLLNSISRPHMFITELKYYLDYFKKEAQRCFLNPTEKQIQHLAEFKKNLFNGIEYYKDVIPKMIHETKEYRQRMAKELVNFREKLAEIIRTHQHIFPPKESSHSMEKSSS